MPVLIILGTMSLLAYIRVKSEKLIEDVFRKLGTRLWTRQWPFLLIGIVLTIIGGCGWIFVDVEYEEMKLWLAEDDDNYQHKSFTFLQQNYISNGAFVPSQSNLLSFVATTTNNDNLLEANILSQIYEIEQLLLNFTWKNESYDKYCHRPFENSSICTSYQTNLFLINLLMLS